MGSDETMSLSPLLLKAIRKVICLISEEHIEIAVKSQQATALFGTGGCKHGGIVNNQQTQ